MNKHIHKAPSLWLGTEDSYELYLHKMLLAQEERPSVDLFAPVDSENDVPSRLEVVEGIGIIPVTGTLITEHNWWTEGDPDFTSYGEIREMLVEAALSTEVNGILMDFDTSGGSSVGISDASDLIQKVSRDFKPVVSFVSKQALSAGYWLASATNTIYAARMGEVGSIGVIAVHREITKALSEAGINVTVFRDGENKALGGPYEKLSDKAREQLQAKLSLLGDEFRSHVAKGRGVTAEYVKESMGDGKTFFAFEALANKMVDHVLPFEEFFPQFSRSLQSGKTPTTPNRKETIMAKNLSAKAAAALAAGADPKLILGDPETPETPNSSPTDPAGDETPPVSDQPPTESAGGEPSQSDAPAASASNELADYLKLQLAEVNTKMAEMTAENTSLKAKLAGFEATQPQMRAIVEKAVNGMKVALGGSAMDMTAFPPEALLQLHQVTMADFQKTFPVGGVSQLPDDKPQDSNTGAGAHRIHAVRIGR